MESKRFLVVGQPDISEREEAAVLDVMRSGWLGNGPIARKFEQEFCDEINKTNEPLFGVATNSCTMGLVLALRAEHIGEGAEVITSPLTFAATVNAILMVGAKPVFCDVDASGCLDPLEIGKYVTDKTKAIIPVHLAGSPANMSGIMAVAEHYALVVIEDAAHAFGGHYNREPLGTIGEYGVFSFYPTKNITTAEGGMVVTNSEHLADKIRILASQGLTNGAWMRYGNGPIQGYEVALEGFKGLMPDILAAIGRVQLHRWWEMKEKRQAVFQMYEDAFGPKARGHSQHLYTLQITNRDKFREKLHEKGIGTGIHYNPLHLEPAYRFLGHKRGDFPMAEVIGGHTVSLPLSSAMDMNDGIRVIEAVSKVKGECK